VKVKTYLFSSKALRLRGLAGCAILWGLLSGTAWAEQEYVVQPGDTLGGIAREFKVTARAIQQHNDLASPDRIAVGQKLRIPPGPDTPLKYIVQPGDTVEAIARKHGQTTRTLVEFNALKNPNSLRVGQVLMIPPSATLQRAGLPAALIRDLDRIRVRRGWTHVVIHHSGTARGNAQDMDRYHRVHRRMENGLGYHFVIGNGNGMRDGDIVIGARWTGQLDGGHLASAAQNRYAIGICLVGNFDEAPPTARQLESLRALVQYLQRRCNIRAAGVTTHTRINVRPTACPGRHFPTDAFLRSL